MTQTSENVTWLTQEAYDQLKAELEHLSGPARAEITEKIAAAREEGDLKENAGYHAAKEEQGKQELRVRQLTQLLQTAKVGEAPAATGVVAPGMVVTIAFDGDPDDTLSFLLASREYASSDIETYSPQSPLGTGVNGKKVGTEAEYELPNGKTATV
ncbi:transcription elongation factor GreA, partial [Streptomyces tubercidicus]